MGGEEAPAEVSRLAVPQPPPVLSRTRSHHVQYKGAHSWEPLILQAVAGGVRTVHGGAKKARQDVGAAGWEEEGWASSAWLVTCK